MKKIKDFFLSNPTIFSILCISIILIGIPYGIYGLRGEGFDRLGGTYILFGSFLAFILLLIDRVLIKYVAQKTLNYIQLAIIIIAVISNSYSHKKIVLDIESISSDYFILIENDGSMQNSKLEYVFPFSKKLIYEDNHAVIKSFDTQLRDIQVVSPVAWEGYIMTSQNSDGKQIQFFKHSNIEMDQKSMDSVMRSEIELAKKK